MMLFVCMFFVCHAGCPGKRSGHSTTYNVTVCTMRFSLFFLTERNGLSNCLQRFHLHVYH